MLEKVEEIFKSQHKILTLKNELAVLFGTPVDSFTRIKCQGFTL